MKSSLLLGFAVGGGSGFSAGRLGSPSSSGYLDDGGCGFLSRRLLRAPIGLWFDCLFLLLILTHFGVVGEGGSSDGGTENYTGEKEMLGKCEQFFLVLMKVPRVEPKLRVFAFKITFSSQVKDLRSNLITINSATKEVKESAKLRQVMQTILTLGNALNQGTARGSAIGFKLDSLLKLSDTHARNNKMTLMHYLCKLIAEKMPELLDFDRDLIHLEAASKVLKNFLDTAEAEVRSLISLYSEVGRNADSLSQYFGEDPSRCPFEQVTQVLFIFVKMFTKRERKMKDWLILKRRSLKRKP
uniref:formin-like protein 3 n=1 Tax=Fragaria vesca subsp. vesca TaxID=101020 RepID=UPI0005C83A14|nr:PREDICTED: formin-like protein 3 [Fragaria vesca subsp. vesca]